MPSRSISPRRIAERDLPYTVDIAVPVLGLGTRYNAMLDWCREETAGDWDHHGWVEPRGPKVVPRDWVRFYFREETDAEAFRERWSL